MNAVRDMREAGQVLDTAIGRINEVVLGKDREVRLAISCLLARGHLLIEDIPGVGKTTLAHALARVLGLTYQRVQFTSDLLPADIIGVSVYDRAAARFEFHKGPVFAQLVLADEVNRATPKAQSALLEAMEESQVTVDGVSHPLPSPFFVVATQNPAYQVGTFPLPESQLDRFLMRLHMGYPGRAAERELLLGTDRRELLRQLAAAISTDELVAIQSAVTLVHTSAALIDYLQAILAHSRESPLCQNGLSPRAGLALLRSAQASALMDGRGHALPEDVQGVLPSVIGHRLQAAEGQSAHAIAELVSQLATVPIP